MYLYSENWTTPYTPNFFSRMGLKSGAFYQIIVTNKSLTIKAMPIKGILFLLNFGVVIFRMISTKFRYDYERTKIRINTEIHINRIQSISYRKKESSIYFSKGTAESSIVIYCPDGNKAYKQLKSVLASKSTKY